MYLKVKSISYLCHLIIITDALTCNYCNCSIVVSALGGEGCRYWVVYFIV